MFLLRDISKLIFFMDKRRKKQVLLQTQTFFFFNFLESVGIFQQIFLNLIFSVKKKIYKFLCVHLSGIHIEKAHCWRPEGNSVSDNLRRFFTGGTPEIEDPTYVAVPSTFDVRRFAILYPFYPIDRGPNLCSCPFHF